MNIQEDPLRGYGIGFCMPLACLARNTKKLTHLLRVKSFLEVIFVSYQVMTSF